MDKNDIISPLLKIGFIRDSENTFIYTLSLNRKLIIDINIKGFPNDAVYISQNGNVIFIRYYNSVKPIRNLIYTLE